MRRFTRNHRLKPPPGTVRLDPNHFAGGPSAFWLMNEGGGNAHDIGTKYDLSFFGAVSWGTPGIVFPHANASGFLRSQYPGATVAGVFSVRVRFLLTAAVSQIGELFSTRDTSGDDSFDLQINASGVHGDIGTGSVWLSTSANSTFAWAINTPYDLIRTVTPGSWTDYINGKQIGSGSLSAGTPLLWNSSRRVYVGSFEGGSTFLGDTVVFDAAVYPFALTPPQVWQLYQRPYDMLLPSGARRGFAGVRTGEASYIPDQWSQPLRSQKRRPLTVFDMGQLMSPAQAAPTIPAETNQPRRSAPANRIAPYLAASGPVFVPAPSSNARGIVIGSPIINDQRIIQSARKTE